MPAAPAEREGQVAFEPFMVEAMLMREASTLFEVSREFEGVQVTLLEPLNAEDADVIARALSRRQLRATGMVNDPQFGGEIYHMTKQSGDSGQPTYPWVVVSARPEANGDSAVFNAFNARINEVWQERRAAAEAASAAEPEQHQTWRYSTCRRLAWYQSLDYN